jgi:hypothetical protein
MTGMKIENALHGHLVAAVFEALLVDAGYQVIPMGVERTIRELRPLDYRTYIDLVHPRLRSLPDLFVLDVENHERWLTEIKHRDSLHYPKLSEELKEQIDWAPLWLILAVNNPPEGWKKGDIQYIRVFEIKSNTKLDQEFFNDAGLRIQDVFPRLVKKWQEKTILKAQDAILRITSEED